MFRISRMLTEIRKKLKVPSNFENSSTLRESFLSSFDWFLQYKILQCNCRFQIFDDKI